MFGRNHRDFPYLCLFTKGSVLEVNVGGVEEHQEIDEAEDDVVLDAPADLKLNKDSQVMFALRMFP